MTNGSLCSVVIFEKELISHQYILKWIQASRAHNFSDKGFCSSIFLPQLRRPIELNVHFFLCMHNVEIHQVRRLFLTITSAFQWLVRHSTHPATLYQSSSPPTASPVTGSQWRDTLHPQSKTLLSSRYQRRLQWSRWKHRLQLPSSPTWGRLEPRALPWYRLLYEVEPCTVWKMK